jgi:hypothetical protein
VTTLTITRTNSPTSNLLSQSGLNASPDLARSIRGIELSQRKFDVASTKLAVDTKNLSAFIGMQWAIGDDAVASVQLQPNAEVLRDPKKGTYTIKGEVKLKLPTGAPLLSMTGGEQKATIKFEGSVTPDSDPKKPGMQPGVKLKMGMFFKGKDGVERPVGNVLEWSNTTRGGLFGFRLLNETGSKAVDYKNPVQKGFEKGTQFKAGNITVASSFEAKVDSSRTPIQSVTGGLTNALVITGLASMTKQDIPGLVWNAYRDSTATWSLNGKFQVGVAVSPVASVYVGAEGKLTASSKVDGEGDLSLTIGTTPIPINELMTAVNNSLGNLQLLAADDKVRDAALKAEAFNRMSEKLKNEMAPSLPARDRLLARVKLSAATGVIQRYVQQHPGLIRIDKTGRAEALGNVDAVLRRGEIKEHTINAELKLLNAEIQLQRRTH